MNLLLDSNISIWFTLTRDPFDRIMIAQAIVEEMPFLSADKVFDLYPFAKRGLCPIDRVW